MGEREELLSLMRSAFNEGFNEGGREHTTHGGGKTWAESRALKEFTKLSARLAAKPDEDGPLLQLAEWCRIEREKLGAIDGYDYRSGEEFGLRRAQNEIERLALSTTGEPKR